MVQIETLFCLHQIDMPMDAKIIHQHLRLTHNRFDLAFKLYYLPRLRTPNLSDFRKECYKRHIKAFSLGTFCEPGSLDKDSFEKYEHVFSCLVEDFEKSGFDSNKSVIPLAKDGSIINGAHRTAAAIFLQIPVGTVQTDRHSSLYDYHFFQRRGVPVEMLDAAAQTFIKYDDRCYLALVWPAARGNGDHIEKVLSRVVYKKCVSLNYNGAYNLLAQAYRDQPWIGSAADNYPGVLFKLTKCFPNFGDVRAYLFQADSLAQVLELKEKVRQLFNIEKHAIHITDTKEETSRIGRLLLNDNAVHFLNHSRPNKYMDAHEKIELFSSELGKRGLSADNYALDSGMVMSVYGQRCANDIDYLTTSTAFETDEIKHHAKELPYHGATENELVDNPKFHFWFNGLKFISLEQIRVLKSNRNEDKDILDAELIKSLAANKTFHASLIAAKYAFLLKKEKLKTRSRRRLIIITKYFGVYDQARILYRKLFK